MLSMLVAFFPVAGLLTLAPGVATVLVIRRAAVSGRRAALMTILGNEIGVLVWAVSAGLGLAAVVAASAVLFTVIKLVGAAVLIAMGIRALLRGSSDPPVAAAPVRGRAALRDGAVTALANPKLAVFYVALFPQFVPRGDSILVAACAMGLLLVALDLIWYSALATLVARAAATFLQRWLRRAERLCGIVLVGLGARLMLEQR